MNDNRATKTVIRKGQGEFTSRISSRIARVARSRVYGPDYDSGGRPGGPGDTGSDSRRYRRRDDPQDHWRRDDQASGDERAYDVQGGPDSRD